MYILTSKLTLQVDFALYVVFLADIVSVVANILVPDIVGLVEIL
jgi:hypothetical protein